MKKILLIAALLSGAATLHAQETMSMTVGNFDNPGTAEIKEGAGSWWERAPFQWYSKYSGIQIIYHADYLEQLAADNAAITEVVFKYGDEGSFVEVAANLNLLIENISINEFEKKPDTETYKWVDYDPSTSSSALEYSVELFYMADEEIHFVLDKPLQYNGANLLITAWSEVTNGSEAQALVTYAMRTGKPQTMAMGSDRKTFADIYDTGLQESAQGPNPYVPVTKFVYTKGQGVTDAAAEAAPARYFNLQGVEVSGTPAHGLYIRTQGGTATKVRL